MSANCNLIVQKANKDNSIVLVQKDVCIKHIEKIVDDATKFVKVRIKNGILNFSSNHEIRINDYLKSLEKLSSLTTDQYQKIQAIRNRQEFYMDLVRYISDVSPPFRSILSAIGTPSYKLAKVLVLKLSLITFDKFPVKDSLAFAEEIIHQDIKLFIGGLDLDSHPSPFS